MKYPRIRNIREDNDITQRKMGEYLHLAQRSYSRYETGERSIPVETLVQIADMFGTSVDYLVERTDIKTPYKYAEKYDGIRKKKIID